MKTIREDIYRGVPVGDWKEVEAAIRVFDSGSVPGARAAQSETLSGMSGMGAVMMLMAETLTERGSVSPFVERRVLKALKEKLEGIKEGSAGVDFDYDGAGVWHKTSLKVVKNSSGHSIEIWAAYVGDKPEANLAKLLGVERGLLRSVVSATFPVKTEKFTIDLEPVFAGLSGSVFENGLGMTAADVVREISRTKMGYYPSVEIHRDRDITVTVYPDGCNRYKVMCPVGTPTKVECEAHEDYGAEPKKGKRPFGDGLLTFNVSPTSPNENSRVSATTPAAKKLILDQTSRIDKALQAIK